jgi:hypothetical protein
MPMDNRLLRPRTAKRSAPEPDTDPPVQLKAENNDVLLAESGEELTTE